MMLNIARGIAAYASQEYDLSAEVRVADNQGFAIVQLVPLRAVERRLYCYVNFDGTVQLEGRGLIFQEDEELSGDTAEEKLAALIQHVDQYARSGVIESRWRVMSVACSDWIPWSLRPPSSSRLRGLLHQ